MPNFQSLTNSIWLIVILVLAVTLIPVGIILFRLFSGFSKNRDLLKNGIPAQGVIMSIAQTGTYVNEQPQVRFLIQVRPSNGEAPFTAQATKIISLVQIPQLQPGAMVEVRYNPQDRGTVAISGLFSGGMAMGGPGMMGGMPPMSGAPTAGIPSVINQNQAEQMLGQQEAANQTLLANGELAQATILSAWNMGFQVNGNNPAMGFLMEVRPGNRPPFQAEAKGVIAYTSVQKYQPGALIYVRYDPRDISRVAIAQPPTDQKPGGGWPSA